MAIISTKDEYLESIQKSPYEDEQITSSLDRDKVLTFLNRKKMMITYICII